ncbi:2OG-Fe(II) oxygenase [Geothrix sp. 21YS21S-2]|uniref:2OG-Fe(II) oxygenase n=1 Tax=Geothrix sp. 21YS21S-2 TaxID=3068893 RepID=UPI0027B94738|nr:2OG-Fe(II) oxygenase [Geothrix sp. 21YS21S-2]
MLNIPKISGHPLEEVPFSWAAIGPLFEPGDADALLASFPTDHFKDIAGYDGEKGYRYRARSLVHMGREGPSHAASLSPAWRGLAGDILSPAYRQAMMHLTGLDLRTAVMEANITDYGPGAWLGPHLDLPAKLVTHVLYFNRAWTPEDGGGLRILRSPLETDVFQEIVPVVGNSAVLVRSDASWHSVPRVSCDHRRAVNVIFHSPGSASSMWTPPEVRRSTGEMAPLAFVAELVRAVKRRVEGLP